jgi:NAD(P)-dependent dehydrogenase (short-subunit alcohol dehydrogenase family)
VSTQDAPIPPQDDPLTRLRLDNRVAIVTGGTRGIGLAIATTFVRAGARVMVSSRKAEHVDQVVQLLRAEGRTVHGVAAHMGQPSDVARLFDATMAAFGSVDVIVNNAATNPVFGPLRDAGAEAFDKIFGVNVKGPLALCTAAHSALAQRGRGAIVNIASIGGVSPEAGLGLYSMSKAALISLTKVLAQEWGADGIRANVICPGLVRTRFSQALWQDAHIQKSILAHQPLQRLGVPEDVAGLALFLASDASAYCTGGVYTVDGGYLT